MKMPKSIEDVSLDLVAEFLSYDIVTGVIVWKKAPSKNVYAGEIAGCVKATRKDKNGNAKSYSYIRIGGQSIPTARIAWALFNGEWPNGKVSFVDGNPLNFKVENLSLNKSLPKPYDFDDRDDRNDYYREHRKVYKTSYSDKDMQRKYGIGLLEYSQMFMAQNGKCAICDSDYGGHRNGEQKALAVDHCHTTNKVRGLLCEPCNQAIGKLQDSPKICRKAADYLEKHSSDSSAEHPGSLAPSTGPADTARTMGRNLVQEEG
jgi:hypothetical protein